MSKIRGLNGRADIFSAVTEEKQFLNANRMQRRPEKKRNVYKRGTLLWVIKAY